MNGWGGRIRTFTIRINSAVSYRLDHAPEVGHITIRFNGLLRVGRYRQRLPVCARASSGASWSLWNGPNQSLNGCKSVGRGKVGIPHCHGNALVPQKLLNSAQVYPGHYETAGEGVPEAMPGESPNLGSAHCWLKPVAWASQRFALQISDHWAGPVASLCRSLNAAVAVAFRGTCRTANGAFLSSRARISSRLTSGIAKTARCMPASRYSARAALSAGARTR